MHGPDEDGVDVFGYEEDDENISDDMDETFEVSQTIKKRECNESDNDSSTKAKKKKKLAHNEP